MEGEAQPTTRTASSLPVSMSSAAEEHVPVVLGVGTAFPIREEAGLVDVEATWNGAQASMIRGMKSRGLKGKLAVIWRGMVRQY